MSAIPAAKHTLQVIRYLAGHSGPVRASTLARDLQLARSTAYHLLRVLQDEGFVIHSPEHQAYGLSPLLAEIGSSVSASSSLARFAQPLLQRLVAETRLPVVAHLGLLNHADVVYASKLSAARAPAVVTNIGVRLPSHLTATGRSMLAWLAVHQLDAIYPDPIPLATRTGAGPTTRAELDALLTDTRDRGWAEEHGDIDVEYASVAAAVLDHNGFPAASVGLTFRRARVDHRERELLGRATRSAAHALSQRIRGRS